MPVSLAGPPSPTAIVRGAALFDDFDLNTFWEQSEYADREYVDTALTPEKVALVERTLGYKLPATYLTLMTSQNGGIPARTNHRTKERTSWAEDHVAITGISGVGDGKRYSLCGEIGSQFWIDKWGYPPIGVYFADCPSAGHDMLCLDYRACGPHGEPIVVHVDQEYGYKITFVAPTFEAFIRGLEGDEAFDAG
jgi:SMI1/KNR4 family protein SUKH-1